MSLDLRGFALTVAGCPYVFTTGGLPAITSSSPLWFGAETDVQTLSGWLDWPTGWSERAKPLDGDLECSAVTFRLHDATPVTGVAADHPALTWLATRFSTSVVSTPLAVAATAAAGSITVGSGAAVGTVPRWVWCEREAMRVTARAGNVLTVTRGALGTAAAAHDTRDPSGLPDVFADIPWLIRRKAVLWGVTPAGVATVLWVGFAVRAPKLSADGARFDLPCDPLWLVLSQAPVGDPDATLRVYGYGSAEDTAVGSPPVAQISLTRASVAGTVYATARGLYPTLATLTDRLMSQVYDQTLAQWGTRFGYASVRTSAPGSVTVSLSSGASFYADGTFLGQRIAVTAAPRGALYDATTTLEGIPRSAYLCVSRGTSRLLVQSLAGLPASWATTTTVASGLTTTRTPSLRAAISADHWLLLSGVTATSTTADGALVEGSAEILPRKAEGVPLIQAWLKDCAGLGVIQRVTCDHWLDGLRYEASTLLADATVNDFDWSDATTLAAATVGHQVARDWHFDGRTTFGAAARECCQIFGCTPVTRGGLLGFYPWRLPDSRVAPTLALTATDIIGSPSWQTWDEGLVNRVKITSDELVIDATDSGSINRYGPGRQLALTLLGRDTSRLRVDDPVVFSRSVLARMGLWADPLGVVKVKVALTHLADLELGALFTLTDWLSPDGAGARGLAGARAVVVARDPVFTAPGHVAIEALLFPRVSYGYAPCARVDALTAAATVSIVASPVQGTSSYSGGNDIAYFVAGDVCELIVRDSTTYTSQTLTVLSTAATTITFTAAVNGTLTAAIAAGTVDVRFAQFAGVQTTQEEWMYVGDDTTLVIDGTAEAARPIAP